MYVCGIPVRLKESNSQASVCLGQFALGVEGKPAGNRDGRSLMVLIVV